ncbi:DinB family protein [Aneurinibacillus tyrosinisolvens]|uniref:DinB family protein n=1 Tax=Aneurinibacillus tyrosinisolvens TaxID=1443435 RepID=UPI00063F4CF1|nr:DinB family protein [Aneurinibacillus tyrosinisolvens]
MDSFLFKQLEFIRSRTLSAVEGVNENVIDAIPDGFNNNIRWNLGHLYLVSERFSFHFAQEPMELPGYFPDLFGGGTKPSEWNAQPPSMNELTQMLREQPGRIQAVLKNRLNEEVAKPFTTGSGLTLNTIGEFVNFTLYHEGMHFNTVNILKRLNQR